MGMGTGMGMGMGTGMRLGTARAPLPAVQVPTIQIFDGAGITRLANLDCQPAQFKQVRARPVAQQTRGTG